MITIGICDDERIAIERLERMINICIPFEFPEYCVRSFSSGIELLECNAELQLLFLDIDMPEADGIIVGKRYHSMYPLCKIIMETGRVDRIKEAFYLEAFRFLSKPYDENELREALLAFWKSLVGKRKIGIFHNREEIFIPQEEIRYIRAYDSCTEFLVGNRWLRSEKSLVQLEGEQLRYHVGEKRNLKNGFWSLI